MVSEQDYPRQQMVWSDWCGWYTPSRSPNPFRSLAADRRSSLSSHGGGPYRGMVKADRPSSLSGYGGAPAVRPSSLSGYGGAPAVRPSSLSGYGGAPAVRPSSLSGYGGGLDRCLVKVPDIVPGKIPKPASISGKITKSMVRYEAVASDPTAVWRIVSATDYKANVGQHQSVGRSEPYSRPSEEPRNLHILIQPRKRELEMARSAEDLRHSYLECIQEIHPMGAPEGNLNSPLTGFSVVATGGEQDQVPNVSVRRIEWENPKDTDEGDFGIPSWLFEDTDEGDFGIPSWLFGFSLPDAVERAKDLAVLKEDAPTDLLKPINVEPSSALRVGQQCLAIGNPFGFDHALTVEFTVKDGYFCSALAQAVKTMKTEEKVLLKIKPQNGFGEEGAVPPNAIFLVDLGSVYALAMDETNFAVVNDPDEAKFDLAQLYMGKRVDRGLRSTGLCWNLPPWPGFCALILDRFVQHSDYKMLENSHSVKQYSHSVLDYTYKFEELVQIWPFVNEERKMLQMAGVWREERVQIKLVDAKLTLDSKYAQLNKLQSDLEDFLSFHRGNRVDKESVRDAERLREVICSMKFQEMKQIGQSKGDFPSIKLRVKRDLPTQHILLWKRIVVSKQWDHKVPVDVFYLTLRISQDDFPQYEEFKHILIEVVQICQQDKTLQLSVQAEDVEVESLKSYKSERNGNEYLFNLIDSPGYVDFPSEVTAALRITDGALVVVDCIEGVCAQTETVLCQALSEKIRPILTVNKMDRSLLEFQAEGEEAYQTFFRVIENANVVLATYEELLSGDVPVYPEEGIVDFSAGLHGWVFPSSSLATSEVEEFGRTSHTDGRLPSSTDTAVIMYTSGSIGLPKGVMITHGDVVATTAAVMTIVPKIGTGDVYLTYPSLAHVFELMAETVMLAPVVAMGYGSALTMTDTSIKIKEGTKGDASVLKSTLMISVPAIMDRIRDAVIEKVGENSFDPISKKWTTKNTGSATCKRDFAHSYYDLIKQIIKICLNDQKDKWWPMLRKHDEKELIGKIFVKRVIQTWLPTSNALLEMMIFHLPFPSKAQKYRVENLYEGPLDDIYATAIRNCDLEGKVATGLKISILDPNYVPGQKKGLYMKSVQRTIVWRGNKLESVKDVPCGNTVAMVGLDQFTTKNAILINVKGFDNQNYPKELDSTEVIDFAAVTHADDFLDEQFNIRVSGKDALFMTSGTGSVKESIALGYKDSSKENSVHAEPEVDAGPIIIMKFPASSVVRVAVQSQVVSILPKLVEDLKRLAKPDLMILCTKGDSDEHSIAGTGEPDLMTHLKICLKVLPKMLHGKVLVSLLVHFQHSIHRPFALDFLNSILEDKYALEGKEMSNLKKIEVRKNSASLKILKITFQSNISSVPWMVEMSSHGLMGINGVD